MCRLKNVLLCLICVITAACGTVTAQKVGYQDDKVRGIRYWLPAPYLLVTQPVTLAEEESLWQLTGTTLVPLQPGDSPEVPEVDETAHPVSPDGTAAETVVRGPEEPLPGQDKTAAEEASSDGGAKKDASGGDSNSTSKKSSNASPGAITIVWLPDYCQMYAVKMTTGLGNQKLTMAFEDGWRLSSLNAEIDNSKILESFTDLAKTFLETRAQVETAGIEAAAEETEEPIEEALKTKPQFFKRTSSWVLQPGLYRLLDQKSCDKDLPELLDVEGFLGLGTSKRVTETVTWEKLST